MTAKTPFSTIPEAIQDIQNGKMIIVVDDEDRENEGDLLMAAHHVTPEAINFMATHGRGLICMPITDEIGDRFNLNAMVEKNTEKLCTAFTVSVDGAGQHGVTTGISASDRAKTIQLMLNAKSTSADIVTPGHIFPLRAREMGVLRRAGHTEAAVDLARISGVEPAGVICEIMKDDGEMARVPDLIPFAKQHQLKMITIKALIAYRVKQETFIQAIEVVDMPTEQGHFKLHLFEDTLNNVSHVALVKGEIKPETLVRVHSESFDGDIFRSIENPSGKILEGAMKLIEKAGQGVILYIRKDEHINPDPSLQFEGLNKDSALRDYGIGAQILKSLGVTSFKLLSNADRKIVGLDGFGLSCLERISIPIN